MPLTYTPRKFISNPYSPVFYMIESDHRTYGPAAVQRIVREKEAAGDRVDKKLLELPAGEFGRIRAGPGKWGSLIRVLDPLTVSVPL